jgi:hypothetical protein
VADAYDTTLDEDTAFGAEPATDDDDQEKADYAFARWACQRDQYASQFKVWTRAILFLLARQWLDWDEKQRRWVPEQNVPKWRQRPVSNLVFGVYRAARAKLTKQRPALTVIPPQNGDVDDRQSAAIGDAVLQQQWRQRKVPGLRLKVAGWLLSTGNAYVEVDWDAEGGKPVALTVPVPAKHPVTGEVEERECACDDDGEPLVNEAGEPDFDAHPRHVFEGDVGLRLVSPLSVRFNPEATNKDDAHEWFVGELWPVARVERDLGLSAEDIKVEGEDELEEFEDLIATSVGAESILGIAGAQRSNVVGDRALVLKYFRKPCEDYPEGRHWVQVNRTPVTDDDGAFEQPLPHGFWPPLVSYEDVDMPGQLHATGLIPQCVSLNREYNALNGKIAEHHVTMAMGGKWILAPIDQNLKISSDPGQKLVSEGYLMGLPPHQVALEALPAPVYAERERIRSDLFMVTGLNEMSMGQKPEGVSSGRGFLVMQEAVDSVFTPTLQKMEEADAELGKRILMLVQRHYSEERTVRIRGAQGQWEIRSFKGADLGESIDVYVEAGSSFPWSKSARQDTALNLLQALPGLVTDPKSGQVDGQKVAKILDVGGLQAFQIEGDADQIEIEMEHAMLDAYSDEQGADGAKPLPALGFWQDHPKHYAGHAELMKRDRQRFERWKPAAKQWYLQHLMQTLAAIKGQVEQLTPPAPPGGPDGAPAGPDGAPQPGQPGEGPPEPPQGPPGAPDAPAGPPSDGTAGNPADASGDAGASTELQPADFAAAGQ